jgi:hypothetical protein
MRTTTVKPETLEKEISFPAPSLSFRSPEPWCETATGLDSAHQSTKTLTTSFSQRTKQSAILENLQLASEYIRAQSKAVSGIIQQLQLFSGYLEQINRRSETNQNAWSVYLMYAQSVNHQLNLSFQGNPLFQKHGQPPLRVHVNSGSGVAPLDLPFPALHSHISLNSFMSGVMDHRLPRKHLIQSCITDLMDELISLQGAKTNLSKLIKESREISNQRTKLDRPKNLKTKSVKFSPISTLMHFLSFSKI